MKNLRVFKGFSKFTQNLLFFMVIGLLIISCENNIPTPEQKYVEKPTASPTGGHYTSAQNVILSCNTYGAEIYYTLDGSTPTTSSIKYTSPITINESKTLKAIAVKTGMVNSEILAVEYIITLPGHVERPMASPTGGHYTSAQNVVLSCDTHGADIYYTLDESTPTTSSIKYTSPITINESKTLKAIAVKTGMVNSEILAVEYIITLPGHVERPMASPTEGSYTSAQNVILSCNTYGAEIYYTLDGSTPTTSSIKYTSSIIINESKTLKAIAVKTGMINSEILELHYIININITYTVSFNSDGGSSVSTQYVINNSKATVPSTPTKNISAGLYLGKILPAHTFLGWFNGEEEWDFNTPISKNITLKAKWELSGEGPIVLSGGNSLTQVITYINNVNNPLIYTYVINNDASYSGGTNINRAEVDLTIIGLGGQRTITLSSAIILSGGGSLTLGQYVTLSSPSSSSQPIIGFTMGVTKLNMKTGSRITGGTTNGIGTVFIGNGELNMEGGEIIGNTDTAVSDSGGPGPTGNPAVYVSGVLRMSGGRIINNTNTETEGVGKDVRVSGSLILSGNAEIGNVVLSGGSNLDISGNSKINRLDLRSSSSSNPTITINSGWTGSNIGLNFWNYLGNASIALCIDQWLGKTVIRAADNYNLTTSDINKFILGNFYTYESNSRKTQAIGSNHTIVNNGEGIGKLMQK